MIPKISIIVPIYNAERYLSKCIDHILSQTLSNFEVLLINDGSTDNSAQICENYANKDSRIKIIQKINGGVSSARNVGLRKSNGEWICFVDSDDCIEPNYLESFGIIDDSVIDLYAQGYRIIDTDKTDIIKKPCDVGMFNPEEAFEILESSDILNSPVFKLYKRSIIEKFNISFDENISYGEDHIFSLDYFAHVNKTIIRPYCGYIYIRQHNSLTKKHIDIKRLIYYMKLYAERYNYLKGTLNCSTNLNCYSIRQYSNLKRLIKESTYQIWLYKSTRRNRIELASQLTTNGLTNKQKALVKLFKIVSKIF